MSFNIDLFAYLMAYCMSIAFLLFTISNLIKKLKRSQYQIISTLKKDIENIQLSSKKQIAKQLISLDNSFEMIRENQGKIVEQIRDFNKFIELSCKEIENINNQFNNRKELEREIIKLKKIIERRNNKNG
jgi:peptidoglycan hydrolase CwlO-like protein